MPRVGLRFPRSQARPLRNIAERIHARELGAEHAALFESAAEAARTGEPLIVQCHDALEAVMIADGFPRWGIVRPAIEELSGTGA